MDLTIPFQRWKSKIPPWKILIQIQKYTGFLEVSISQVNSFQPLLPFLITYCRYSKEERSMGWKWGKGNHSKVNETQGFLNFGHSNWTIWSLLSWFCTKNFPTFKPGAPFSYYCRERKDGAGSEKGNSSNVNETQGFLTMRPYTTYIFQKPFQEGNFCRPKT